MLSNLNDSKPNMHFNILQFNHPETSVDLRFTKQEKKGWQRFIYEYQNDYFKELIDQNFDFDADEEKVVYTDFSSQQSEEEDAKLIAVKLAECNAIAKAYYTTKIQCYLKEKVNFTDYNFLKDTTVWIFDKLVEEYEYKLFKKFTLRVQFDEKTNQPEMLLTYEGTSKVSTKNIEMLIEDNIDTELLTLLTYDGKIFKHEKVLGWIGDYYGLSYPVINHDLREVLKVPADNGFKFPNKYKKYHEEVSGFIQDYMDNEPFKKIAGPLSWKQLNQEDILFTSRGSNKLVFKEGFTHINPYYGLRDGKGPHMAPSNKKSVKTFYIFHKSLANTVHEFDDYLRGEKGFISLASAFKIPLKYEHDKHILYEDSDNPIPEIKSKLQSLNFDKDTTYLAFYITEISKDEQDLGKFRVYHQIKELLLHHGITSQVVHTDTINSDGFKFSVTNIGVAVLAKLGGIPWRLQNDNEEELIVGVGAFKQQKRSVLDNRKFIGSAFAFKPDGRFLELRSFPENEMVHLSAAIHSAIRDYREKYKELKRLVIHFYKRLSNNTRYHASSIKAREGFPFPVKLQFWSSHPELIEDKEEVSKLIDQVYQFSRMYWKSVSQQPLPSTIKYPEMLAEITPHFSNQTIPPFGRKNLWFL